MKRIHEVEGVEFRNCLVNAKIKKGIRRIIFLCTLHKILDNGRNPNLIKEIW